MNIWCQRYNPLRKIFHKQKESCNYSERCRINSTLLPTTLSIPSFTTESSLPTEAAVWSFRLQIQRSNSRIFLQMVINNRKLSLHRTTCIDKTPPEKTMRQPITVPRIASIKVAVSLKVSTIAMLEQLLLGRAVNPSHSRWFKTQSTMDNSNSATKHLHRSRATMLSKIMHKWTILTSNNIRWTHRTSQVATLQAISSTIRVVLQARQVWACTSDLFNKLKARCPISTIASTRISSTSQLTLWLSSTNLTELPPHHRTNLVIISARIRNESRYRTWNRIRHNNSARTLRISQIARAITN